MKTSISNFLLTQKPKLNTLLEHLNKKYKYVSILGSDTIGTSYSVSKTNSNVSDSDFSERGFVVRVYNGINYSEYSFNIIEDIKVIEDKINEIVETDVTALKNKGISFIHFPKIEEKGMNDSFHSDVEIDPFTIPTNVKLDRMIELMNEGASRDERFIDFRVRYEEVKISKIFLSNKKDLSQSILYTNMSLICIGRNEQGMKYDFDGFSGLKGYEIFDEAYDRIEKVTNSVVDLFKSQRVTPGEYEIICDPSVSGLIAHEAFGHGVEMDMFVKNRAKGKDYIGEVLASSKTNMRDGALSATEVGTYLFDDEGTLGTDTLVLDNGVLKSGISDLLSALKLGTVPTGNGRRESFERKAYARMTNTFFEGGNDTLEDMIKHVKKGYLLEGFFSGMEDPKNWGIQCVLAKGKEIINGEFTGNIISPVTLTGYVPDLLKSIDMISNTELNLSGTGACGKGHKEWVKTSTGGTYIKAIGRLS
jgi:TldD protein